ncbi:MAG: hypothetical protein KC550_04820, partial [Nanoarchaeota archaeon]|nr:hypothetical protein [Nanoarchaeota archaeon]
MNSIKSKLDKLNDDAYLFKLDYEYKGLISSYESIIDDIDNLDFSSYTSLNSQISSLDSKVDSFEDKIDTEKKTITDKLKQNFASAYSKIGENKNINSYSTKDIIEDYCYDFNNVLPRKFSSYNLNKEQEVSDLNEKRLLRNNEIDSYTSKWNELNNLLSEIETLSENNNHDELENSCNMQVTPLKNSELDIDLINSVIDTCTQFKTELETNIADNSGFINSIVNFFSSLFSEKTKIQFEELNNLESYKNNEPYVFSSVSFSEESKSLAEKYCNINIEKVYLDSSKSIGTIEKESYSGNDVVDFKTQESECDNNKCYDNEEGYPILFVHGHLFNANDDPLTESIDTFDKLIRYIAKEDDNFYDAGKIVAAGSTNLGTNAEKTSQAAMYRTTYYGGAINNNRNFEWVNSKYDSISDYADKLEETIDSTLALTNRKQVKIVAHSMGGLVVREYIRKNGDSKIETFIMIATPNQGVEGDVASNCAGGLGSGSEVECNEMKKGSSFLSKLNSMSRSELPEKT